MENPQVLNTLATKRREIERHIGSLEADLDQARRDLSAILAATAVFSGDGPKPTAYMNLTKLFPRFELPKLCRAALDAATGPISTRDIAAHVIAAKGLDGTDRHLRTAIAYKVVQHMRRLERERRVGRTGKVAGADLPLLFFSSVYKQLTYTIFVFFNPRHSLHTFFPVLLVSLFSLTAPLRGCLLQPFFGDLFRLDMEITECPFLRTCREIG